MDLLNYFLKLYKEKKQLALLNLTYVIIAVVFVVISGICALFNQSFGVAMLIIPLVAIAAICANVVVWALSKLMLDAIESRKDEKSSPRKKVQ